MNTEEVAAILARAQARRETPCEGLINLDGTVWKCDVTVTERDIEEGRGHDGPCHNDEAKATWVSGELANEPIRALL
ncbi:hypothetical protein [Mycolicibacterium sp. BK634]|uniref:hypothetical protein n=1 Tax=Mycolicibacterium sp. BK634 TaxID=2587099 RepID=UPI001615E9A4|nr:hypothetical protein [Mycolicibacterium sp. BK634]